MVRLLRILPLSLIASVAFGQAPPNAVKPLSEESYIQPPDPILSFLKAPRWENMTLSNLSPDGKWFAVARQMGPVTLADVSRPYFNLGGEQVDPNANRSRSTSMRAARGIELVEARTNRRVRVNLPPGLRVSALEWSPSGRVLAFLAHFDTATRLWVAEPETGAARQVSDRAILCTEVESIEWLADESGVFVVTVPQPRLPMPVAGAVPSQPRVQVTDPAKSRNRPVRNLLETRYDADRYEYFVTGQLARIDMRTGKVTSIGAPAMIRSVSAAPDGSAFRVTTTQKPFSYLVYASQFGTKEELWGPDGKVIVELANRPLRTDITPGAAGSEPQSREQRRLLAWRPDGNGMSYVRSAPTARREGEPTPPEDDEQGGRGRNQGGSANLPAGRQQIVQWLAPYGDTDVKVIYEHDGPVSSVSYSADCTKIFLGRTRDGKQETVVVDLAADNKITVLNAWTSSDFYANPGSLMSEQGPKGPPAVRISPDGHVFFSGTDYARDWMKQAPRPFVDRVALADGKKERIWQSAADVHESISAVLDPEFETVVISRQSPTTPPDQYRLSLRDKNLTKLTANRDFHPEVTRAQVFRIPVKRADGFKFMATVTMPTWWVKGSAPLPGFFWFYPNEVVDQRTFDEGKRTTNINAFNGLGNLAPELLVMMGYAVVEPDCPIVGPADRKNDSYIPDLRNNLSAVIDELSKQGFIDRSRLGIGGHSYGAFSTANAMVHTPFFKAGIAGDGAYNRLLTPMQFQSETRILWEARETYLTMSPMLYAEQLTGALLMYHGLDDNNPGTDPINSVRLFNALEGLGKTAALYMYPYEDHSPAAIETYLDLWARWVAWLDTYVKNAGD